MRKGIAPRNWRQIGPRLLVPLHRAGWSLCDLQYIDRQGGKRFAPGLSTRGVYHLARWLSTGRVNICEGAATAVAIASHTGETTLAAMSRGNLLAVAQGLRRRHVDRPILIWSDNDHKTPGNPGLTDATHAAMAVGGSLTWPMFAADSPGTDFLDFWQEQERQA